MSKKTKWGNKEYRRIGNGQYIGNEGRGAEEGHFKGELDILVDVSPILVDRKYQLS